MHRTKVPSWLGSRRAFGALLVATLLAALPGGGGALGQDFTDNGFITTWLLLGPYENSSGCCPGESIIRQDWLTDGSSVFESTFFPKEGDTVDSICAASGITPCYKNPDASLAVPTVEYVTTGSVNPVTNGLGIMNIGGGSGETDTVNFNVWWLGAEGPCADTDPNTSNAMAYAITYVNNTTGADLHVIGQMASDDSAQIIVGSETVFVVVAGRFEGNSGTIQNQFEAVLKPGVNRVMVKVFEGCGNWAFRLRFVTLCGILKEPDLEILSEPPPADVVVLVTRDLPDTINGGDTVNVSLTIKVLSGNPGAATVRERIPFGYTFVSASDGGTFANSEITWNIPAPLTDRTLTYRVQAPAVVPGSAFRGTLTTGGKTFDITGDSGPAAGDPGWIRDWLVLDPIDQGTNNNSGKNPGDAKLRADWITDGESVTERTVVPDEGAEIFTVFGPGFSPGKRYISGNDFGVWRLVNDDDGCVDFNPLFPDKNQGGELEVMTYGAVYVINPLDEPLDVVIGVGTDDSGKLIVNGETVWVLNVPRGFCGGLPGGPQDRIPMTLRPGKNLIMLGAFDGCGGWNMGARIEATNGDILLLPMELDSTGYVPPGAGVDIQRDIPDDLVSGGSGIVTITVRPVGGAAEVVLNEKLPPGLTPANPDSGGVVDAGSNTVTWNLGLVDDANGVSVHYTLTVDASVAVDTPLPGTAKVGGETVDIGGDTVFDGTPFNPQGFIKLWNHLGPLAWESPATTADADAACHANNGADLGVDWLTDGTVTEATIRPYPGLITKIQYGGTGAPRRRSTCGGPHRGRGRRRPRRAGPVPGLEGDAHAPGHDRPRAAHGQRVRRRGPHDDQLGLRAEQDGLPHPGRHRPRER
ncbi:MAG: DUF11 domain-containing protein [Planctomycetes bacterium]|nr:DUF11 domain-containing protein [Planctomycetota bacterium]